MRIAYLCADFGIPIQGHKGASVHVRELVSALVTEGHEVRVISPNPGTGNALRAPLFTVAPGRLPAACGTVARTLTRGAVRPEREAQELAYNAVFYRRTVSGLRSWRPDLIYERYSLFTLAGLALARRLGVPHLLEVNAPLRLERARTKGLAFAAAARLVERRLFGSSDAVLTVSSALRRYVLAHGGRRDHTQVLENGVDTERFHPRVDGSAMRARWGLPADALVIGFAGSLKPWHGLDTLIDAFALLRSRVPNARLLIAGSGPLEEQVRARVAALGLGEVVVCTGAVAHDAMPEMLAAMDIGAAPYLPVPDFYFSPLKLYEYMASGLAVVASATGEIPTLVRDGTTGLLCPPADPAALATALGALAGDPALRARLGAAARAGAEQHTWVANARAIEALVGAGIRTRHAVPTSKILAGRFR
jgi:glycosyltransferase involved in cell wall biosynthesis